MANFFKAQREKLNLTQREIADALVPRRTPAMVGSWERNKSVPDMSLVDQLSEIYKSPAAVILKAMHDIGRKLAKARRRGANPKPVTA